MDWNLNTEGIAAFAAAIAPASVADVYGPE
jgi:hypothetical protein